MLDKLIWTGLVTAVTAATTAVGFRIADAVWRETMKTPPPVIPKWARRVVGRPVNKGIFHRIVDPVAAQARA